MGAVVAAAPQRREARATRRAFALATAAYVLGMTAHTTFIFYLAPVGLRAGGVLGHDAWVFSGTAIATMLAVLPAGRLADAYPRRRILRVGLALLGLAYAPLLLDPTLPLVLLATALTGTGLAFLFVSFTSYVADLLARGETSGAYGLSGALAILASALGPFVASLVFRAAPGELAALKANALLFGAAGLAGMLLTLALPQAPRVVTGPAAAGAGGAGRGAWRAAWPFVVLYVLMGAGYGMMLPYFAVYFLDVVGIGSETWGLLLAAATVAGAAGSVVGGRVGRRDPHRTMLGSQALHAAASVAFALPLGPVVLGAAYVARNLFATSVAPIANALLMGRSEPAARGLSQGYASLAWNLGWAAGAAAGGVLLARLGGLAFPLAALLGVAGASAAVLTLRRTPAPSPPGP